MSRVGRPPYLERLAARTASVGTVLCLGLDPDPAALPDGFSRDVAGIEAFATLLLDAALPFAAAVKPNLAFYEAFGAAGLAALERLRARIPDDVPVVADGKRGDVPNTSERFATAIFDRLNADAITVNPYLGEAAIAPLLERDDRFAYILCRTSNEGAGELQNLAIDGEPLWTHVARRVTTWGPGGTAGLVVGATAPAELEAIRGLAPGLALLVPGVGAQGGSIDAVLRSGPATSAPAGGRPGGGLLVNVSRGIAGAAVEATGGSPRDPGERVAEAARSWAAKLPVLPLPPA